MAYIIQLRDSLTRVEGHKAEIINRLLSEKAFLHGDNSLTDSLIQPLLTARGELIKNGILTLNPDNNVGFINPAVWVAIKSENDSIPLQCDFNIINLVKSLQFKIYNDLYPDDIALRFGHILSANEKIMNKDTENFRKMLLTLPTQHETKIIKIN